MKKIIKQQISRKQGLILEPIFGAEIMGFVCPKHFILLTKTHSYLNINFNIK